LKEKSREECGGGGGGEQRGVTEKLKIVTSLLDATN